MPKMLSLRSIVLQLLLLGAVRASSVVDMLTDQAIDQVWMETGFFYLDHETWVHAETNFKNFTDPVVFLSLPEVPGDLYTDGYPAIGRIRNVNSQVMPNGDIITSFEARIYLPNDTYCNLTRYTPRPINPPLPIAWMVAERGAFNVSGNLFFVDSGPVFRITADAEDPINHVYLSNPKGCDPNLPSAACRFNSSAPSSELGAIAQVQSWYYDRFLIPRGVSINNTGATYVLQPHDSTNATYYEMFDPMEILGFMHYSTGYSFSCREGLTLESHVYRFSVQSVKIELNFTNTFDAPPGVFGLMMSLRGRDSTGLRTFDRTTTSAYFIAQEDTCTASDPFHTRKETVTLIIIGELSAAQSNVSCAVSYTAIVYPTGEPSGMPTGEPTSQPSALPTSLPTGLPTGEPTVMPTGQPTVHSTSHPTSLPSSLPTSMPTKQSSGDDKFPGVYIFLIIVETVLCCCCFWWLLAALARRRKRKAEAAANEDENDSFFAL